MCLYEVCVEWGVGMCVCMRAHAAAQRQRQLCGVDFFPSTFKHFPGFKLGSPDLRSKLYYPLSHLAGPFQPTFSFSGWHF